MEKKYELKDLEDIMDKLLGEDGCAWDKEQTHDSLKKHLAEESYEVIEAIERGDKAELCDELGDVLLQVVFHAKLAEKENHFTTSNVIEGICKKMIRRHRHIYGEDVMETSELVKGNWEKIKREEKTQSVTESMQTIPRAMPALFRAEKVQTKASNVRFDFMELDSAFSKLMEEVDELKIEISKNGNIEEELGDILFSIVNIARFLQINPEFALTKSTEKFINRFGYIENVASSSGRAFEDLSEHEMDLLWNESKDYL